MLTGRHRPAALGTNDRTCRLGLPAQFAQGLTQLGMDRDQPPARFLGGPVVQFDCGPDLGGWGEHHLPGQIRDLCRPQPGLDRQQHDQPVAQGMSGRRGEDQQVIAIVFG